MSDFRRDAFARPLAAIAMSMVFCAPAQAASGFTATLGHDSNVNLGSDPAHRYEDSWLEASARYSGRRQLQPELALAWSVRARGTRWREWGELDLVEFGGSLGLRYKPGIGRAVPRYRVDLSLLRREVGDSQRSGTRMALALGASRPIGDLWNVSGSYNYSDYNASHTVFDAARHRLEGRATRLLGDAWSVSGTVAYLDGDFTMSAPILPMGVGIWTMDQVFLGSVAYRYPGDGTEVGLIADYVTARGDLFAMWISYATVQSYRGSDYDRRQIGLSYTVEF
jgi:hypothetical protein